MADDINKYPTPTAYKDVDKKYLGLKKILRAMTNNALYRKSQLLYFCWFCPIKVIE